MELIDCKALEPEIVELRALEAPPSPWRANSEAWLITDNGQRLLHQDDRIVPVEYADRGDALRYDAGLCLWCLIDTKGDLLRLRALRCRGALALDLQIGVDDRLVDQLHKQRRIKEPTADAACAWMNEELLLAPTIGLDGTRALARTNGTGSHLTLVGRRHEADLRERDGRWTIARLSPARQYDSELTLLHGELAIVDASGAAVLRSPAQRQQFQEYLDAHGDYVALWRRYAAIEWGQATEAGRTLNVLRYQDRESRGEEQLRWRYAVDPEQARAFMERWEALAGDSKLPDLAIEACAEPPAWMLDAEQTKGIDSGRPVVGERPVLQGGWLILSYHPNREHDVPPPSGLLCLSIHGQRKAHERREQALERIRNGANPMPQLRLLLEGQPVPTRTDWRREKAMSRQARAAFHGEPTDMQKRALDLALNTPDIAVIIGPPGTGKTQVISALQRRLAEVYPDPRSIQYQLLITSFQHDAVDNALGRIEVFGLPGLRVGGRRRDAENPDTDRLSGWRETRLAELGPRLDAAIAAEPVFAALQGLRDAMTRLRIQPLTPGERVELAHEIDNRLQDLADAHRLRPTAATEQRWRDWLAARQPDPAIASTRGPTRRLWRRAIWSLRTSTGAFADDGTAQCLRLLDLADRRDHGLPEGGRTLLEVLAMTPAPSERQLADLAELREGLLTASRPDLRPPVLRNVLDTEGCRLLDTLLGELDVHLKRRPEWARLAIIGDYLDDLRLDPTRIEQAVRAYTTVLGATCQQAAAEPMRSLLSLEPKDGISFDTVVIDEAARATPLDLLIPMAMGRRRIVLVGDHRQLPHLLDPDTEKSLEEAGDLTQTETKALEDSLFERLVLRLRRLEQEHPGQPKRVVMLDTQFRMHPALGDFVSRTFYEAVSEPAIRSGRPATDFGHQVPELAGRVCAWIDVPASGRDDRDRRLPAGSRIRAIEAERAAREARRILDACPGLSLGVITFYAAQRELILEHMGEHALAEQHEEGRWRVRPEWARDERGAERLLVGTVDAFQGKEFDIVLLSIVRTDAPLRGEDRELALTRKYGFLRVPNRMNVAMSRQRRLLIAIGDIALARAPETAEAAPGLAAFLDLCEGAHGRVL
jgi:hypothetical protein